jgi:tetratricopeptide (TPR) repeat protein
MIIPLLVRGGDLDEALRYIEEAGPVVRASGARGLVAWHKIVHGLALRRTGELERARELLEGALKTDGVFSQLQTYVRYLCGIVAETEGDVDRAAACYRAVVEEGHERAIGTSFAYMRLALLLRDRGEIGTALDHARTALRLERKRGTIRNPTLPALLAHAALLEHEAGDETTARSLLAEALELGRRFDSGYSLGFPYAVRALIGAGAGDLERARADRDQVAVWVQESRDPGLARIARELDARLGVPAVGSPG